MAVIRRRTFKRLVFYTIAVLTTYHLSKLIFPPDSPLYLVVHWAGVCLHSLLNPTSNIDSWLLSSRGPYSIDTTPELGILVKTGYGTRERLSAQLEGVLGLTEWEPERAVVVADFASAGGEGRPVIRDAVGELMEYLEGFGFGDADRFKKYRELRGAIEAGDEERAQEIGRNVGWELDALKFIWGLDILYKSTPLKDWYLILDDDTYPIPQTLILLIHHLDPSVPHYIGNTVGDYKARFAHGGSGILLSRGAVEALYMEHPDIAHAAHIESLTETWGDKLVATTLQRIGIFVDERFNHLFNGESPADTRIWADRFCTPLASFHELKKPEDMWAVWETIGWWADPVLWSDVWGEFAGEGFEAFSEKPMREGHDFVGRLKEEALRTSRGVVDSAERCMRLCVRDGKACLAWKWEAGSGECHTAPWMVVGRDVDGVVSGVNGESAAALRMRCKR